MLAAVLESGVKAHFVSFEVHLWQWAAFGGVVVTLMLIDVLLVHREAKEVSFRSAAIESAIWISLGLSFTLIIAWWQGGSAAGEYLSGYLIEKSLSVDNVFVWALIMSYFAVPKELQFRALFWGIVGALVLRAGFIFGGVALLNRFEWIIYVFGAFLLYTAVKLLQHSDDEEIHPENNPVLVAVRRVIPITKDYEGHKLISKTGIGRHATPLLAVLIVIATTDVIFAVDSIPAILAVSREQFLVLSSNAFAIMGLRALYFLLADLKDRFEYLQQGLAVILAFVGVKMLLSDVYHIATPISLGVIAVVLGVAIVVSIKRPSDDDHALPVGSGE